MGHVVGLAGAKMSAGGGQDQHRSNCLFALELSLTSASPAPFGRVPTTCPSAFLCPTQACVQDRTHLQRVR